MKKWINFILCTAMVSFVIIGTQTSRASSHISVPTKQDSTIVSGHIIGVNKKGKSAPLQNASVTILERATKKKLAEVITDAKGLYRANLSAYASVKEITIIVLAKGYEGHATNIFLAKKSMAQQNFTLKQQ
jgi:hypothetical protein